MKERKHENRAELIGLGVSTVVIGVIAGIGADILGWTLDFFENLFLSFKETAKMPVSMHVNPWQRLFSVFIGAIIASIIWYFLHRKWHLTSVNEALKGKKFSFIGTIIHDFTQTFYIGTGGSVGREAAPRELAAMFAQKWSEILNRFKKYNISSEDKKLLIAAAAGAGLAGQYVAPLSGTFFAVELLYKKINKKTVSVSLAMSVIATILGTIRDGFKPYYLLDGKNLSFNLVPFVIIIGPILGTLGYIFRKYVSKAKKKKITDKRILLSLPLAGLATGVIAYFYPYIMGNGRGIAQMAYNTRQIDKNTIIALIICFIAKAIVTAYTIYSGAYGGVLTPSISIGAAFGVISGMIYSLVVPNISLFEFGLVGSATFLAASQQSPLMALCLVFELCHLDVSALIPMGLAVAISVATGKIIFGFKKSKEKI